MSTPLMTPVAWGWEWDPEDLTAIPSRDVTFRRDESFSISCTDRDQAESAVQADLNYEGGCFRFKWLSFLISLIWESVLSHLLD